MSEAGTTSGTGSSASKPTWTEALLPSSYSTTDAILDPTTGLCSDLRGRVLFEDYPEENT